MICTPWTAAEEDFLREHYAAAGPARCSEHLRRTVAACQTKAMNMGLHNRHPKAVPPADFVEVALADLEAHGRCNPERLAAQLGQSANVVAKWLSAARKRGDLPRATGGGMIGMAANQAGLCAGVRPPRAEVEEYRRRLEVERAGKLEPVPAVREAVERGLARRNGVTMCRRVG